MVMKAKKEAVPTEEVKEYRVKICWFTPDLLSMMLEDGNEINVKVTNGAPEGVKVVGAGYDPQKRLFYLHLEHESFEPIKVGEPLPNFTTTLVNLAPPLIHVSK